MHFCSLKYRKFKSEVDLAHLGDETDDLTRAGLSQTIDDFILQAEEEQDNEHLGEASIL